MEGYGNLVRKVVRRVIHGPGLVEERAVCHRDSQTAETHPQDHVIRSIIAVATTLTGKKSPDGFSAEDHSSSSCDVAVAASAQTIAVALSQEHRFAGLVAAKQVLEPGDALSVLGIPKSTVGMELSA